MKKPTKKKPAPKPVECWAATFYDGEIHPGFVTMSRRAACLRRASMGDPGEVIRVRIVPVAAKRRKGGK